jgi:SAM-dependent methyltransferase
VTTAAEAYDRYTGRYGPELSAVFLDFARIEPGSRVLDVGAGTGNLTSRLAEGGQVTAVDPSSEFVHVCRERVPGADVHVAAAEALPFADAGFDAVLSQLVIQALDDAPAAAREMRRVAAPGGSVAACVWDFAEGMPLLVAFWGAARATDPIGAPAGDAADQWCTRDGLRRLWEHAGLEHVETTALTAGAAYADLDDAWFSFAAGAGTTGAYAASLDEPRRQALRREFERRLGVAEGPFRLEARAWAVRGSA